MDLGSPVDEVVTELTEFDDPGEMSIPQDTAMELFVVYDKMGNEVSMVPNDANGG